MRNERWRPKSAGEMALAVTCFGAGVLGLVALQLAVWVRAAARAFRN